MTGEYQPQLTGIESLIKEAEAHSLGQIALEG